MQELIDYTKCLYGLDTPQKIAERVQLCKNNNKLATRFELECNILHIIYRTNKDIKLAFEIMLHPRSHLVFKFFEEQYINFNRNKQLLYNFIELLEIDAAKTVYHLLTLTSQIEIKR